jgi:adenine-specific DNA-methyltransferase
LVGLENHLNYIYRTSDELSEVEALGIAALFNSVLIDRYFRAISGNTQVNAAEIRAMPVPCAEKIQEIGLTVKKSGDRTSINIERIVGEVLGLPKKLLRKLCEVSK